MGRTRPTYRDQLRRLEEEWDPYRRALRRDHQVAFDDLFEYAQMNAAAAGQQNAVDPFRPAIVSMILGLELDRRALEDRIESLEAGDGASPTSD